MSKKEVSTVDFSGEIFDSIADELGYSEMHCHMEGMFDPFDLTQIAQKLNIIDEIPDDVLVEMHLIRDAKPDEPKFMHFLKRLSTRWLRYLSQKALMKGELDPAEIVETFYDHIFTKYYGQKVRNLELFASPFNLVTEGDMRDVPVGDHSVPDEIITKGNWNAYLKKVYKEGTMQSRTITLDNYFEGFRRAVEKNPNTKFYYEEEQPDDVRMNVGLKWSIRRIEESEAGFRNEDNSPGQTFSDLGRKYFADIYYQYYVARNIVGVDICSDESRQLGSLDHHSVFIGELNKYNILWGTHAGELSLSSSPDVLELAYLNLERAVVAGAKKIGHGVRMFDHTDRMVRLLEFALESGIFIECNVRSNASLDIAQFATHPVLQALKGNHPLFSRRPELLDKLKKLILVSTDDPAVFQKYIGTGLTPMARELEVIAANTDNLGGIESPQELLILLNGNAGRAAFEHLRMKR